jgi:hypothetical protein
LHWQLGDTGDDAARSGVFDIVAQMSWIHRDYGVILTRVSFAEGEASDWFCEPSDLSRVAEVLNDGVENASVRGYRYPRPALVLSPRRSALLLAE